MDQGESASASAAPPGAFGAASAGAASAASAAPPDGPHTVLSQGDTPSPVSKKRGHDMSQKARAGMTGPPMVTSKDVNRDWMWKGYVRDRPAVANIIGPGIARAQWRFLAARGPSRPATSHHAGRQVPQNRRDLVLARADGI